MKRVLFLGGARYAFPLDPTSKKKFQMLREVGEIYVIGLTPGKRPLRFTQHAHFYLFPASPPPLVRYGLIFFGGPFLALWVILRHSVNILVAQSPYEGFAAAWAKVMAGWAGRRVSLVIESHGDFEANLFLQRKVRAPRLYRWLMPRVARFAFRHADVLRAVSYATRAQLEQWAPGKPLIQFPAWTDSEVFFHAGANREEIQKKLILYAGVLVPGKGVHHLIRAFHRVHMDFPEADLMIVGREANGDYARTLRKEVQGWGLHGRVRFLGEVSQAELARWMAQALVFVLPSLSEALGRVVFEAMLAGAPVIGSRVGGIPEMVQDGMTGFLVPPGDEDALADRLRWMLSHPEEAKAMGQRARAFARRFFSSEAYLRGYQRVFELAWRALKEDAGAPV